MILYKDNLIKGRYEITPEELATSFLESETGLKWLECCEVPLTYELNLHIAADLNSSFVLKEENNKKKFEVAMGLVLRELEKKERV